ncbi:MAG TPA: DinB family protein [Chryseolinea sp.]|nr:DinB family protein [Chryseolinea sp.]HPH47662.1 DinB family protein [Chryseolinea sp.]HPM28760.1 DinB family protein [Chryseolinea sp.]
MNSKLQRLYDQLENDRKILLAKVELVPEEKFNRPPAPNKWSLAQVLSHIVAAEHGSTGYMKKKSLGIDQVDNSGIVESLKIGVLIASQRLPFLKFKAPKIVVDHTPQFHSAESIIRQWDEVRADLKLFLEKMEDKNIRKKIYKHPFAGRLDVVQAVTFFREHIIHHSPQINRLLH